MILKHGDRTFETGDIIKHFKFETITPEYRKDNGQVSVDRTFPAGPRIIASLQRFHHHTMADK